MLAKKYRLTVSGDFAKVQSSGRTFQSKNFGVAILDRGDGGPPRFAFVVSTKIAKDAVDRNTIKRHMSETVRMLTNEVKNGLDVVFLAKTSIMRSPADEIVREVRAAVRESGITK
jgi:ribonuclease P protein component